MALFFIAAAAFGTTMLGGLFAIKLRDRLHIILGFSAGAVVAVAFFDLIPEALTLDGAHGVTTVTALVAAGFFVYLLLDRLLILHSHNHDENGDIRHEHSRGHIRAGSLSIHSFLDGVGIGLAFQVSAPVGFVVAAAVLAHDFSDGINTVNVVLRHGVAKAKAMRWLLIDAAAPALGVISTLFFTLSKGSLGLLLALFAGFFLYIGASDLVPESHHAHPKFLTTIMTLLGAAVLYLAVYFAGI
jgi:ZIP family zinc transporter